MIREYIRMKKNEWKVKAQFYGVISFFLDSQKDIVAFVRKMYDALKDVEGAELRDMLVSKIVEAIREEG